MTHATTQSPVAALVPASAPARQGWLANMRRVRLAMQVLTLALVLAPLWWPLILRGTPIYQGNYAASRLNLGAWSIPMSDPFTALSAMLASRSTPSTMLLGAALILAFYVLVRGRTFCAFACPVHLVLEFWDKAMLRIGLRRELIGEAWPRWLNVAMAGLMVAASAVVAMPLFEPFNPINALIRSLQHLAFAGLWLVASVMALEALAGRRVFCRHLCPVGGVYSAVNRAGMAGVAVDPNTCTGCRQCTASCLAAPELAAAITRARESHAFAPVNSSHCTLCFECAAACEHTGIVFHHRWRRNS